MFLKSKKSENNFKDNINENINPVEDFDYSGQSREYIETYKKWRENPDNPFAYNYIQRKNEITFSEDSGFIHTSSKEKESETLSRIHYLFGTALMLYILTEFVISRILVSILDIIGVNIHNSFLNYSIYGGKTEVMVFIILITVLKFCLPSAVLYRTFKMPVKASIPYRLQSVKELFLCLALGFLATVLTSIPSSSSDTTIEFCRFFNDYSNTLSIMNQHQLVIYMLFDIIVISVMTELLFRGVVFQALRQFGDFYAVIISAMFSTLIAHDTRSFLSTFIISFVSAISVLRTGTMFTAFSIRIIDKIYIYIISIMDISADKWLYRSLLVMCCFLISLAVTAVIWNTTDKKSVLKRNFRTSLTLKQKFKTIFNTLPTFAVIFLCVIILTAEII